MGVGRLMCMTVLVVVVVVMVVKGEGVKNDNKSSNQRMPWASSGLG